MENKNLNLIETFDSAKTISLAIGFNSSPKKNITRIVLSTILLGIIICAFKFSHIVKEKLLDLEINMICKKEKCKPEDMFKLSKAEYKLSIKNISDTYPEKDFAIQYIKDNSKIGFLGNVFFTKEKLLDLEINMICKKEKCKPEDVLRLSEEEYDLLLKNISNIYSKEDSPIQDIKNNSKVGFLGNVFFTKEKLLDLEVNMICKKEKCKPEDVLKLSKEDYSLLLEHIFENCFKQNSLRQSIKDNSKVGFLGNIFFTNKLEKQAYNKTLVSSGFYKHQLNYQPLEFLLYLDLENPLFKIAKDFGEVAPLGKDYVIDKLEFIKFVEKEAIRTYGKGAAFACFRGRSFNQFKSELDKAGFDLSNFKHTVIGETDSRTYVIFPEEFKKSNPEKISRMIIIDAEEE